MKRASGQIAQPRTTLVDGEVYVNASDMARLVQDLIHTGNEAWTVKAILRYLRSKAPRPQPCSVTATLVGSPAVDGRGTALHYVNQFMNRRNS